MLQTMPPNKLCELGEVALLLQDLAAELRLRHYAVEVRREDALDPATRVSSFRDQLIAQSAYVASSSPSVGVKPNAFARKTSMWTT